MNDLATVLARRQRTGSTAAMGPQGQGPRIYNLFPLLAGTVDDWMAHLPRIARMRFDWVFLNPIHPVGMSGSLYAIKDPYRLDERFRGRAEQSDEDLLRGFIQEAGHHDLKVMLDLVINHTARDARLVDEHPEWYRRDADGTLISPSAVDPADASHVTVWGDLAALDYDNPSVRDGAVRYFADLVRHYIRLGVRGFRCDAAYQVPSEVWRTLIDAAREVGPDTLFAAETLGCTVEQVENLSDAGFDYLFNSAKWWDFRADWLLDQYNSFRTIAPSIAFPESHDTDRLVAELTGTDDVATQCAQAKMRYLFAATFSTGVLMPMGYEFGFTRRLDVVGTTREDWRDESQNPRFDLTGFIAEVNGLKAEIPALNVEGPQRRVTAPHDPVMALLRTVPETGESALVLINPDPARLHAVDPGPLLAAADGLGDFTDVTPAKAPLALQPGTPVMLEPLDIRVLRGRRDARPVPPLAADSESRLRALAENRIAIECIYPELDGGRFAVKRVVGDVLEVWADIFGDGHDKIAACVRYRPQGSERWAEAPMRLVDNDRWQGQIPLTRNARYVYRIEAWRDLFATWRAEFVKKRDAGQRVATELIEGRHLIERAVELAAGRDRETLAGHLARIRQIEDAEALAGAMLSETLAQAMARGGIRTNLSVSHDLEVVVDREAARFAAWYELFPRSMSDDPNRHGTFDDVIAKLPYVRDMGFDVLYFTPIHPIGRTNRKGRNNTLTPGPDDPGSPYAIGSEDGGHDAVHPELGNLDDFRRLVEVARAHDLEIALDFAIQCSPDHPWIRQHPEWFDWRPDGTIKFAENPPKKYEDIVNVHFYRQALPDIWYALRDVVLFWVEQGVKIFRVDNPHTKPFPFWEWMIREVQDRHPDTIFLSEAFTRPKVMKRLAKLGFTQSYTYFTWRHTKSELTDYLVELTQGPAREYMRPNFFANTPDINPPFLQSNDPAAYKIRATLAATLSSVYGIYSGFELCEGTPVPGKEEYLDSEKYEIRAWDWDRPGNIRDFIRRLNRIRRDNPALHTLTNLRFYGAHDDRVLFYGKMTQRRDNIVLIAVNLDPSRPAHATLELPLKELGLPEAAGVGVEDLFTGARFSWYGRWQTVHLDPMQNPCGIWRITPPMAT